MTITKICQGISDISDSYSGFIVDQWGVLHDGDKPYEGVVDCLKELKARNKHVIILSNSGKTAEANRERLKQIGIPSTLYNEIVTSGEMTWQGLKSQSDGIFKDLGKSCFLISRGGDTSILEGTDIVAVSDPDEADFIIISGSDAPEKTIEDYEAVLRKAARKRLKALCANPDSKAIIGQNYVMGAGSIARRYQDFGGVVHYIGKPHLPIFQYCLKMLQEKGIYPGETVMVGDTMSHDILGGVGANIDTCLVKNGLHAAAFRTVKDLTDLRKALAVLSAQYNNIHPTYMVDRFKWGKPLPDRKHKKRAGSKR
ncbi:MAG: TIGR01459 family HAD-type hydrolase [Alphaproteobacteria bacterium]|nr:TIGR01459 family HAD-type hydrolase [Alphaproteobacteria bacterium]MCD8566445.1 TIGR01459 family HAD-type hydrolase [Alphaproteobacteria bacterium]